MDAPIIGAVLAVLGGCVIAVINDRLNRWAIWKKPGLLGSVSVLREMLNVAYLVAVYLLRSVLPWALAPLLIGAAVGLTVPSILFSLRLAKENDAMNAKKKEESDG